MTNDKPANENGQAPKKKPFWKRIIGALGGKPDVMRDTPERSRWDRSVDPKAMRIKGRPTRADLLAMLETLPENATKH